MPPGGSTTIHFDLGGEYTAKDYHLDVLRQPTVAPDQLTTRVKVASGWSLVSGDKSKSNFRSSELLHRDETVAYRIDKK